jgi:hypothetical protein
MKSKRDAVREFRLALKRFRKVHYSPYHRLRVERWVAEHAPREVVEQKFHMLEKLFPGSQIEFLFEREGFCYYCALRADWQWV